MPGNIDQARFGTGTETSWDNDIKVYVFAPDVWSTYIYAGVAAETAVVLRQYDSARADAYAESATRAMSWAESQWAGITGDKRDQLAPSVDPQRATAAAAMLMLTSDDHWNDVFADASTLDEQPADVLDCPGGTCDAAWVYASVDPALSRPAVRANAVESMRRTADAALDRPGLDPVRLVDGTHRHPDGLGARPVVAAGHRRVAGLSCSPATSATGRPPCRPRRSRSGTTRSGSRSSPDSAPTRHGSR